MNNRIGADKHGYDNPRVALSLKRTLPQNEKYMRIKITMTAQTEKCASIDLLPGKSIETVESEAGPLFNEAGGAGRSKIRNRVTGNIIVYTSQY